MINSALLYLNGVRQSAAAIRLGVAVASHAGARVRGLTLVDSRAADDATSCESAVYAQMAYSRQSLLERQHRRVQRQLSQACLKCGLDFDVRRATGNPLQLLPREARFHDLVITSVDAADSDAPATGRRALHDLPELVKGGVRPLLAVHPQQRSLHRVLLAYDGSDASSRAIRSFLSLGLLPEAECRVLAVADGEVAARRQLREVAEACGKARPHFEYGCVVGKFRSCLARYVEKWQADLVVLGVRRGRTMASRLLGAAEFDVLDRLKRAAYLAM